jgi:hypothetical protein
MMCIVREIKFLVVGQKIATSVSHNLPYNVLALIDPNGMLPLSAK